MDSYNLKINVSEVVYFGDETTKVVYAVKNPFVRMNDRKMSVTKFWAPTLARSPSVYFNRINLMAAF